MTTHENASIVKCSECAVKFQFQFTVLEDEVLTKAELQSFSKNMQFFHKGKPRNNGSKINSNLRILHSEDVHTIITNLKHVLEVEKIALDSQ